MATITAQTEQFGTTAVRVTWPNMKVGDVGEKTHMILYQDRSVQVQGTFGVGGAVVVEGSNDDTTFVAMTDMRGNTLSLAAAKIEQIEDCSFALRPAISGGDETTNITVSMFARKGV